MAWQTPRIGLHVAPGAVTAYDLRTRRTLGTEATVATALAPFAGTRARLSVVLSDAHCRCVVTPRPPGVRNRGELEAAAESRVRTLFGDTERWRVELGASPSSGPDFIAAADAGVLDTLEGAADAARVRIVSVRPHWVAWLRHFGTEVRRGAHWVVSVDGSWATLGHVRAGQCVLARTVRLAPGLPLEDLIARERALADVADASAPVWLGAAGAGPASAVPATALWNVEGQAA